MFCKFCGNELEENVTLCPSCGRENAENFVPEEKNEQPAAVEKGAKKQTSVKNIVIISTVLVAAALLIAVVMYALGGGFTPKANDIYYKDSYTVEDDQVASKMDDVVATMGNHELTNAMLQIYYWEEIYAFLDYYGSYIQYFGLDLSKPMSEQVMDEESGLTWEQYFVQEAISSWERYKLLCDQAESVGFDMPEEYKKQLEDLHKSMEESMKEGKYESMDAMMQADYGAGSTYADYQAYLQEYYLANLYFSHMYDNQEVTQQDLEDYFKKNEADLKSNYGITKDSGNLVDYLYILVAPEGGTKDEAGSMIYTDAQWEAAKTKAQGIYDKWLAGDKSEESFAEAAQGLNDKLISANGKSFQSKFSEMTVDIRHILICPEGGTTANNQTTYTEEEWEAARVEAQKLLDDWVAGGASEESFAALANEHSDDNNGNITDGGIYANVKKNMMVAEFDAWIFDENREYGDNGIVKTRFGYHLMFFIRGDRDADNWIHDENRKAGDHTMVKTDAGYQILYFVEGGAGWIRYSENGVRSEKSSNALNEWVEKSELEVQYKAIALAAHTLKTSK